MFQVHNFHPCLSLGVMSAIFRRDAIIYYNLHFWYCSSHRSVPGAEVSCTVRAVRLSAGDCWTSIALGNAGGANQLVAGGASLDYDAGGPKAGEAGGRQSIFSRSE